MTFLFQGEVAEHVISHNPGAKASSDFATFPVSSFVKVNLVLHTISDCCPSQELLIFKEIAVTHVTFTHLHVCRFLGQGREAGGNSVCRACCHPMHPRPGTSAPPRPVPAAAAPSAPPPHDLTQRATGPQHIEKVLFFFFFIPTFTLLQRSPIYPLFVFLDSQEIISNVKTLALIKLRHSSDFKVTFVLNGFDF